MKIKLNYIVIPLFTIAVSTLGGYFTSQGVGDWYKELIKPEWTPDGSVIGIIWTLLYILVTAIVLVYWNKYRNEKNFNIVIGLFIVNAILNATWSFTFFTLNYIALALAHIVLLNLTTLVLIILLWPTSRLLSLGLLPYIAWVTIAGTLNYFIWILN